MVLQSCCKLRIDVLIFVHFPIDQSLGTGFPEGGDIALGKNAPFSQGEFLENCLT